MNPCRLCKNPLTLIHDFGKMPLANAFLAEEDFKSEYFFALQLGFCPACFMAQLIDQPPPEKMFHETYPFFTGSSRKMIGHFTELAAFIKSRVTMSDPFIVEVGSNDGTHLKNFQALGWRHLGIEPSTNVAQVAEKAGIPTLNVFFTPEIIPEIIAQNGLADVVVTTNVLCHIPDLDSFISACDQLLKPGGLLIFEDPYLGDILTKTAYDQIYDEHVFYFSLLSVQKAFGRRGFCLIEAHPQWTHGGSMRYVLSRQGEPSKEIQILLQQEKELGLDGLVAYQKFSQRVEDSRQKLKQTIHQLKAQGKRLVGYAATSKSTTVLNYCQISELEYLCDTTPIKQGKFSPGAHIPVVSPDVFHQSPPDCALLFGWNHQQEILEKEQAFTDNGGKFLFFVPEVALWP